MLRRYFLYSLIFVFFLLLLARTPASAQSETPTLSPTPAEPAISSPLPGQALQGSIPIIANTSIEGFKSVELAFSYYNHPTDTWFPIFQSDQPVKNQTLTQWDTSTISDGVYTLRMTILLKNGKNKTVNVSGLRVRNYTPIETDTPLPSTPTDTPMPGNTPSHTETPMPSQTPVPPTLTPLAPNPAQLAPTDILISIGKGALAVTGLFALAILYQTVHVIRRRE